MVNNPGHISCNGNSSSFQSHNFSLNGNPEDESSPSKLNHNSNHNYSNHNHSNHNHSNHRNSPKKDFLSPFRSKKSKLDCLIEDIQVSRERFDSQSPANMQEASKSDDNGTSADSQYSTSNTLDSYSTSNTMDSQSLRKNLSSPTDEDLLQVIFCFFLFLFCFFICLFLFTV